MKILFTLFFIMLLIVSCNKDKLFDGPSFFEDNFESYVSYKNLFKEDDELWSFSQITREENNIIIDTLRSHSGNQSLKFSAIKTIEGSASKSSIVKQKMAFWEGETLRVNAWYYIEGEESLEWLFLADIEEQASIGAGPGMRLALVNNKLRVEHKFIEKDIVQESGKDIEFPRNKWVEIVWEIKLSQKNKGGVKLWQDGELIISSENNRTLPKDLLYVQQGTKGMYSSIEFGITANSQENNTVLWVDDIKVEKVID